MQAETDLLRDLAVAVGPWLEGGGAVNVLDRGAAHLRIKTLLPDDRLVGFHVTVETYDD